MDLPCNPNSLLSKYSTWMLKSRSLAHNSLYTSAWRFLLMSALSSATVNSLSRNIQSPSSPCCSLTYSSSRLNLNTTVYQASSRTHIKSPWVAPMLTKQLTSRLAISSPTTQLTPNTRTHRLTRNKISRLLSSSYTHNKVTSHTIQVQAASTRRFCKTFTFCANR